jgi:hypothetical protein
MTQELEFYMSLSSIQTLNCCFPLKNIDSYFEKKKNCALSCCSYVAVVNDVETRVVEEEENKEPARAQVSPMS